MRAIDGDALKEIIENSYEVTWDHDYKGGFKDACVSILDEIDIAPTIEPERKSGKWIDGHRMKFDGTFYWYRECDQCGYERNDDDTEKDSNFCPNCGSPMVKGEQDV